MKALFAFIDSFWWLWLIIVLHANSLHVVIRQLQRIEGSRVAYQDQTQANRWVNTLDTVGISALILMMIWIIRTIYNILQ